MVIGIGDSETVRKVSVRWPSGRIQELTDVPARTLLTVHEDPSTSAGGEAFVRQPYPSPVHGSRLAAEASREPVLELPSIFAPGTGSTLAMFTTTAMWCEACARELPELARLRSTFAPEELAMFDVPSPADPKREREDPEELRRWGQRKPYRVLHDLPLAEIEVVERHIEEAMGQQELPCAVITDSTGRVLHTDWATPSVSKIRGLLAKQRQLEAAPLDE
jgi:hypothetical protein